MKAQTFTVTIRAWPLMGEPDADDFARWLEMGRDEARLPFDVLKVTEQVLSDPAVNTEGKRRRDASDTSRAAALAVMPRTGKARYRVLWAIVDAWYKDGYCGRTDEELAGQLGLSPNTVRPRRVELVEGGWIHDSGERRVTMTGHDAIVWKLTPAGCRRVNGLHD